MSFIIRDEQIVEYETALTDEFIKKTVAELRAEHTEDVADYTDEELYAGTSEAVKRAESYGLEGDADVKAFVKLMFTIGWYFDLYEPFHEILADKIYAHYEKIPYLFQTATDEDWNKAAALSNEELEKRQN